MKFSLIILTFLVVFISMGSFATTVAPVDSSIDPLDSAILNDEENMQEEEIVAVDEVTDLNESPPAPIENDDL